MFIPIKNETCSFSLDQWIKAAKLNEGFSLNSFNKRKSIIWNNLEFSMASWIYHLKFMIVGGMTNDFAYLLLSFNSSNRY